MTHPDRPGRLAAILRAALSGGAAGGFAAAISDPDGAGLGVAGGAIVGAATEARRQLAPLSDELIARADDDETRSASMRIPAAEARLAALETFADAFTNELRHEREARSRARVAEVGRTLLAMIAEGHATPEDLDTESQREAIVEAIRFALDALTPEAIPIVARLAGRPVDHFFRATCRVVVDLDASELSALRAVIGSAARALPGYLERIEVPRSEDLRHMAAAFVNVRRKNLDVLELGEWSPYTQLTRGVEWKSIDVPVETTLGRQSQVFALLIAHRLASAPERKTLPDPTSTVFLRMPIATILDLHFVLAGERLVDPRGV